MQITLGRKLGQKIHHGYLDPQRFAQINISYPKKLKLNDKEKVEGENQGGERENPSQKNRVGYAEGCCVHYTSLEEYGRQRSHSSTLQL